jgi:hypothetical protein
MKGVKESSSQICVICRLTFEGQGQSAEPVKKGRCCNRCNDKHVIPARIRQMRMIKGTDS